MPGRMRGTVGTLFFRLIQVYETRTLVLVLMCMCTYVWYISPTFIQSHSPPNTKHLYNIYTRTTYQQTRYIDPMATNVFPPCTTLTQNQFTIELTYRVCSVCSQQWLHVFFLNNLFSESKVDSKKMIESVFINIISTKELYIRFWLHN